jgi:hypothetical protein
MRILVVNTFSYIEINNELTHNNSNLNIKYGLSSEFEKKWETIERMKIMKNERSQSVCDKKNAMMKAQGNHKGDYEVKEKLKNLTKDFVFSQNNTKNTSNNVLNRLENLKQHHIFNCSEKNSETKENTEDFLREEKLANKSKISQEESIFEFFARTENEIEKMRMKLKGINSHETVNNYNINHIQSGNTSISNNNHIYTNSIIINNNNNNDICNKNFSNILNRNVEVLETNKVKRPTPSFLKPIEINRSEYSEKTQVNEEDATCDNLIILSNNNNNKMNNDFSTYSSKKIVNKIQNIYDAINNKKKDVNLPQNSKLLSLLNRTGESSLNIFSKNDDKSTKSHIDLNKFEINCNNYIHNSNSTNSTNRFKKKLENYEKEGFNNKRDRIYHKNNFDEWFNKICNVSNKKITNNFDKK